MHRRTLAVACCLALALAITPRAIPADRDGLPKTQAWIEVMTDNFTLYSGAGASRTKRIAVQLERFRQALGRITRGFELTSDIPTMTFVFKNGSAYEPYRLDRDGEPMNVVGYFLPRPFRNYITMEPSSGWQPVVYHEFFHAVMDNTLGSLPVWLNEGMAEYFSTFEDRNGSAVVEVGHTIPNHLLYLDQYGFIDWAEFFDTTTRSSIYNEGTRQGSFYAQAWLLVHYLNADDTRGKQLNAYLGLLRSGKDEDEAFLAAFGKSKRAVGADVERYREGGRGGYVWWDFGEEHGDVAVAVRELDRGEVLFRLGELLAQRGQREAAERHLEAARAAGWHAISIDTACGVAALYGDDESAAETAFRKSVAAEHASAEPYVLLGQILMGRFSLTPEATRYNKEAPPLVAEAQTLFLQGLDRLPDHFETLVALSGTYIFSAGNTAPGVRAIERAKTLRPLDTHMLQIQAALLARNGKARHACRVIEREILPKDAEAARLAEHMVSDSVTIFAMERIEADDREAAKNALGEAMDYLPDVGLARQAQKLYKVVADGGQIVFEASESEDGALERAVVEFNRAAQLTQAGRHREALEKLEALSEDCVDAELCKAVREQGEELRQLIEHNELVERFNTAIELANAGDRKGAVDVLREMEATTEDPEALRRVQDLLRELGARVSKQ